jgi:hypothetical protein
LSQVIGTQSAGLRQLCRVFFTNNPQLHIGKICHLTGPKSENKYFYAQEYEGARPHDHLSRHSGRAVARRLLERRVEGKKLYRVKYDSALITRVLAAYDKDTYGETKVIEINFKDWEGDTSKLSEKSMKGLLVIFACRSCAPGAEEAARDAARQQLKRWRPR